MFIYNVSLGIFTFYNLLKLTSKKWLKKKKEFFNRKFILLIQCLHTDQILLINLSDSCPKWPLKFFFLPIFLKSFNSILKLFTLLLFLIWFGSLLKECYFISWKKSSWLLDIFKNLSWQKISSLRRNIEKMSAIDRYSINYFERFN